MLGAKVSQVLCTKITEMDAVEKWFVFLAHVPESCFPKFNLLRTLCDGHQLPVY